MGIGYDTLVHGVYVVATVHEGRRAGLTAAYVTQLSDQYVLISLGAQSHTRELISDSHVFGLTLLAADQVEVARYFGQCSSRQVDKFATVGWHTAETGAPLLDDGVVALDCRVVQTYDEPSTQCRLFVGKIVVAEALRPTATPLVFHEDDY